MTTIPFTSRSTNPVDDLDEEDDDFLRFMGSPEQNRAGSIPSSVHTGSKGSGLSDGQGGGFRPEMSIEITSATAHYSPMGMHIKYSLQCTSHDDMLRWVVQKRYTECRTFHTQLLDAVNKRFGNPNRMMQFFTQSLGVGRSPVPAFPEKLIGSSNRSRLMIEQRRVALQNFFRSLCDTRTQAYGIMRPYLMSFVCHPDVCDGTQNNPNARDGNDSRISDPSQLTPGQTNGSVVDDTCSETFPFDLDPIKPSTAVETVWRLRPQDSATFDSRLLISRPCAYIGLDVDHKPHIIIRTDRTAGATTRAGLQHRYEEFLSFCKHVVSFGATLPTCDEAHTFFVSYRKAHPAKSTFANAQQPPRNPYLRERIPEQEGSPGSASSNRSQKSAMSNQSGSSDGSSQSGGHDHGLCVPYYDTSSNASLLGKNSKFVSFTISVLGKSKKGTSKPTTTSMHLVGFAPLTGCRCTDQTLCRDFPQVENRYVTKSHIELIISPPVIQKSVS